MAITASMVAELRAKTDAPMMECKKALTEADGDMAKAEELLRVKLGSKAGKAASRITAEGVVTSHIEGTTGAMLEVNCETDFVTKNDSFLALAQAAAVLCFCRCLFNSRHPPFKPRKNGIIHHRHNRLQLRCCKGMGYNENRKLCLRMYVEKNGT